MEQDTAVHTAGFFDSAEIDQVFGSINKMQNFFDVKIIALNWTDNFLNVFRLDLG